jgi:hypothetical protein
MSPMLGVSPIVIGHLVGKLTKAACVLGIL